MALRGARGLFRIWIVATIVWLVGWLWATCEFATGNELFCETSFLPQGHIRTLGLWDQPSHRPSP
jgi:hypothetical protein